MGYDDSRREALPPQYQDALDEFERKKKRQHTEETTRETYIMRLIHLLEYLRDQHAAIPLIDVTEEIAGAYRENIEEEYADSGYRQRIVTIHHMWDQLGLDEQGTTENSEEPWSDIFNSVPDSTEVRENREGIGTEDIDEVRNGLADVKHPLWHAFFLLLFKTLARKQEASNILLGNVHIQDPSIQQLYNNLGITLSNKVKNRPDTLYIRKQVSGNKRKKASVIPIDEDLKAALIRWLAARPMVLNADASSPLFTSLTDRYEEQLSPTTINDQWQKRVPSDWRDRAEPIRPHDSRHWGVQQLRGDVERRVLKYIRGDKPDTIDKYDYLLDDYDRKVRRPYLAAMPSLYF